MWTGQKCQLFRHPPLPFLHAWQSCLCPAFSQQSQDCGRLSNPSICWAPETWKLTTRFILLFITVLLERGALGKCFAVSPSTEKSPLRKTVIPAPPPPRQAAGLFLGVVCIVQYLYLYSAVSHNNGGCVDRACYERQTNKQYSWRSDNWMTNWQTSSALLFLQHRASFSRWKSKVFETWNFLCWCCH